jgi:glycosyltransferase involved in cell wall biosynthesis
MACARAVVASDIPGPDELVHNDRTGFRFPPGNAAALAACLARFIDNPELAAKMGVLGRRFVQSEGLLLDDSIDRHITMYKQVLASRKQTHSDRPR